MKKRNSKGEEDNAKDSQSKREDANVKERQPE